MRIKTPIKPAINTREEAEIVMNQLALVINNQRAMQTRLDAEILAIKEKYADAMALYADDTKTHTAELQDWAQTHPSEFPKDRKSLKLTAGTLGFRTGTPKLSLVSRAWNWVKVLAAFVSDEAVSNYIRNVPEINKEAILADYAASDDKAQFANCLKIRGVKVDQDETFFVEPDLTPFQPRVTEAA